MNWWLFPYIVGLVLLAIAAFRYWHYSEEHRKAAQRHHEHNTARRLQQARNK